MALELAPSNERVVAAAAGVVHASLLPGKKPPMARGVWGVSLHSPAPHALDDNYIIIGVVTSV